MQHIQNDLSLSQFNKDSYESLQFEPTKQYVESFWNHKMGKMTKKIREEPRNITQNLVFFILALFFNFFFGTLDL